MSTNTDLPGTGGDVRPRVDGTDDDVEGHRKRDAADSARRDDSDSARRDGSESARRVDGSDEEDVEGHRLKNSDDSDSLYRLGPTTEGEFAKRGPGENPHGDR